MVVTKTRNGMELNRLFHPVLFQILRYEAIQSLSLNPKNFDLGIPNSKSKLFVNNQKIIDCSVLSHSVPDFSNHPFDCK